ncbi:glycosyltransferase [Aurantiacibacter spongiae]|uniref:glycosyltransferase n=1 Tax=Aurantiacibacter spongiae TaxID=2488860 RepID=UPI0013150BF3|nr:glycosyltransferase [Aurantiacibacter spongiae]
MSIHFIVPPAFARELGALPSQRVGEDYPYWLGGRFNWAAQSYLILREYREGMTISSAPRPERMNFAHCMTWRETVGSRGGEYRISVRADYPRLFDCDFEILQNPNARCGPRQAYLPYWPVPGMIPRADGRRSVERIAYGGRIGKHNLDGSMQGSSSDAVANVAVIPPDRWHDMSDVDLLVAIRDFDGNAHDNKPPSKLFNAWNAGIPLVAGTDSAFSAIGRAGVDYIRVETQQELQLALARLRSDPAHYARIVDAGRQRAVGFTREKLASQWLDVIENTIAPDYARWNEDGGPSRRPGLPRFLDQARDQAASAKRRLRELL